MKESLKSARNYLGGLISRSLGKLFLFFLGVGAGYWLANWESISFDNKLELGDLVDSLTTLLATLLIGIYAQKWFGQDRAEKDLIISKLVSCIEIIKELRLFHESVIRRIDSCTVISASALFERLASNIEDTERIIEVCDNLSAYKKIQSLRLDCLGILYDVFTSEEYVGGKSTTGQREIVSRSTRTIKRGLEELIPQINRR
tara:strand:- start:57 stop:662 length:606 start_codon:yes stop_codon:yes gene_type:complete